MSFYSILQISEFLKEFLWSKAGIGGAPNCSNSWGFPQKRPWSLTLPSQPPCASAGYKIGRDAIIVEPIIAAMNVAIIANIVVVLINCDKMIIYKNILN